MDIKAEEFDLAVLFGKPALFSYDRIDPKDIPEGVYCYEVRHSDNDFTPVALERNAFVNYGGTVLSKAEIPLPEQRDAYLPLTETDFRIDEYASATLEQYQKGEFKLTPEPEQEIRVLVVEPMKLPAEKTIPNKLEAFQSLVGGYIEAVYPFDNVSALICNEEGKLTGLPLNRRVGDDIITGTFFLCGADNRTGNFTSLTNEQMEQFRKEFEVIELYGAKQIKPRIHSEPER